MSVQPESAIEQLRDQAAKHGRALVPLRPNRAMTQAMDEDGWQWEDLLAAAESITEEQYDEISVGGHRVSALTDEPARHAINGIQAYLRNETSWPNGAVKVLENFVDQAMAVARALTDERAASESAELHAIPFQQRVQPWMMACFGPAISADFRERNHRFFEESSELVQACGMSKEEAHMLVDYVYGRPVGEKLQEVGGVMVTLAALCLGAGHGHARYWRRRVGAYLDEGGGDSRQACIEAKKLTFAGTQP